MTAERWRSHAFGLALEGDVAVPGLPPRIGEAPPRRHTLVLRADAAALDAAWPRGAARTLSAERPADGSLRTVEVAPDAGYRLDAPGYGLAHVGADGAVVHYAARSDRERGWSRHRFVVGRVLPFAATLAGLEPLHAGAVVLDGRAVAVLGASGTGKSSVTARLMLAGAPFLTDDVLALESAPDGGVLAHPGAAIVAVRDAEAELLGDRAAMLGAPLGEGGGKRYWAPARADAPVPLGAVVLLRRDAPKLRVAPVERLDARELLAAAFVPEVRTPARMLGQLELVSRLGRGAVLEIGVPRGADAGDVARALLSELAPAAAAR